MIQRIILTLKQEDDYLLEVLKGTGISLKENKGEARMGKNMPITFPDDKAIVTVAQAGAPVTKQMTPNLPEQPDAIAESAYACCDEGASHIPHIHGRDKQGQNTPDIEVFKAICDVIRDKCNMIIQFSTGGGPNLIQEQRIECLT